MNEKENLNNYEKNERYLAGKLFTHIPTIKNYQFTSGHVCYDALITLMNGTIIISEFKVRNFESNKYPDYILQVDKLINLIRKAKMNKYELIYYINFFENKNTSLKDFIVFDLSIRIKEWKISKPIIKKMWMNSATYKNNNKIQKDVILLKYNENTDMKGSFSLN